MVKRYRLYLDESGDHTYSAIENPANRYLGLTGCIVETEVYRTSFQPALEALKQVHFPHSPDDPVILHRNDIINRRGPFWRLRDPDAQRCFNEDLLRFLEPSVIEWSSKGLWANILGIKMGSQEILASHASPTRAIHLQLSGLILLYMKTMTKSRVFAKRFISQFMKGLTRKAQLLIPILAGVVGAALIGLLVPAFLAARKLTRRPEPDPPADPSALGLPYEEVSFPTEDGLTLRGWFIPAPAPARGTIIFCHGHGGSMDGDLGYVPVFQQHGYHVLMFDFRAHGRSQGKHVSMSFHERKDVLAAVRFLESKGIHEVGLLGFSMGGATAIITAPLSPAVKAVVTDSAFATLDTAVAGGLRVKGIPEPIPSLVGKLAVKIADVLLACRLEDSYPIRWVHRVAPRGLFIIHGEADIYVPAEDARRLYALAGEPKQLWMVPGAGHREIDQTAPREYLPNILAFFDRFFPTASGTPRPE